LLEAASEAYAYLWSSDLNYVQRRLGKWHVAELSSPVLRIMYHLLSISFYQNSSGEILRLGMLAFSAGLFLEWRFLGLK
jgi:hypothetical protein